MKIWNRLKRIWNLSLTDPKAWDKSLWNLVGSQSLSGEKVTEETALTYSAFWNAVLLIAGTVGSLPLHLMQRQGKGKIKADKKSLYHVMHYRWNPYMTAMAGRETMMNHILTWGNGYAEIVQDGMGNIQALWPITPERVTPISEDGIITYEIRMKGEPDVTLPWEKVLHIPGLGFDGIMGYSIVSMARKSIGLGMAMETFGSLFFGQGTHPDLFFSTPGTLSKTAKDNLRESVAEYNSGLKQSHRMMFLEEGLKPEKIGIPPEDSQFLESRQFQVPEIARWFNLPPHKLKDLTRSSFNNIESEQISFVTDSILPWLIRLEQNYYIQLLTISEQKQNYYFKHIVEGLLRGDAAARGTFYRQMFNIGAMSINEIREKEDMDPDPNPLADEKFVPMNMTPLKNAGKQIKTPFIPEGEKEKRIAEIIEITGGNNALYK